MTFKYLLHRYNLTICQILIKVLNTKRYKIKISSKYKAGLVAWGVQCGLPNIPGVYASTAYGICFIDVATKCRHGNKYADFISVDGCENWLDNEKVILQRFS
jgi:hypothetical protein